MPAETTVDTELGQAVTAAASCDWQETPATPVCGAVAVWVANLPCGCRHFCCHPHKATSEIVHALAREAAYIARALGFAHVTVCAVCLAPLDLTRPITWERI